jgi:hypothetical protein
MEGKKPDVNFGGDQGGRGGGRKESTREVRVRQEPGAGRVKRGPKKGANVFLIRQLIGVVELLSVTKN